MTTYDEAEDMIDTIMSISYGQNWFSLEERVFYAYVGGKLQGLIDAGMPVNSRPFEDMIHLVSRLSQTKTDHTPQ